MHIALATCRDLPDWEVDDRPLHDAFRARGVELASPAWDDAAVDWSAYDACLIRTTWDYMDRRDAYVQWAQRTAAATRLFNPADIVAWNTHKRYLADLESKGVPVLPTVWCEVGATVDLGRRWPARAGRAAFSSRRSARPPARPCGSTRATRR